MKVKNKIIALLFFFTLPCFANTEIQQPFFLSVSGSGGASLNEGFSYLINPALLSFQKRKKIGLSYSFLNKNHIGMVSLMDHRVRLPVAVTYQRKWLESLKKGVQNQLFFSSSFKISPFISLGVNFKRNLQAPYFGNGSLGSFIKLSSHLGMSLFIDNILKEQNKNLRLLTIAGAYRWKNFFSIQTDLSKSAQKFWILRGGVESFFQSFFSVQVGAVAFLKELDWQELEKHFFSGGLTFHSPRLKLQYALQSDTKDYQHSFTLGLSF